MDQNKNSPPAVVAVQSARSPAGRGDMRALLLVCACIDLTYQAEWSYNDQQHWGGACASGERQSPIDIQSAAAVMDVHQMKIRGPLTFRGYSNVDLVPMNNGHSLKWQLVPGAPAPTLSGGPLLGNYSFVQLHLHWISEHSIDGQKYPLEIHMVHESRRERGEPGPETLAVIGIMAEVRNVPGSGWALDELMPTIPGILNRTEGEPSGAVFVDLKRLLSLNPDSYYHYLGSLTTPGCDPIVSWLVMDQPVFITDKQYSLISRADVGGVLNFRHIQPTNRTVYRSVTSCAAVFSPGLAGLLAIFHCLSSHVYGLTKKGICHVLGAKRRLFGMHDSCHL